MLLLSQFSPLPGVAWPQTISLAVPCLGNELVLGAEKIEASERGFEDESPSNTRALTLSGDYEEIANHGQSSRGRLEAGLESNKYRR